MTDVEFFPVIVTEYPTDDEFAPLLVDPAAARIARVSEIVEGDLILAQCCALGRTVALGETEYFNDQYAARPKAFDPTCDCGVCCWVGYQVPTVVITDGAPYDVCDPWPADGLALIVPARSI